MIILIRLCGFLFLLIMFLNIPMGAFGKRIVEIGNYDSDAWLQKVNKNPNKYKISILLALIEHVLVITLTIMLFIVFSPYNIILGIVWVPFRMGEGLVQIYDEKNYWRLLNIARKHSVISGAEKKSLSDLSRNILQSIKTRYKLVGFFWAIGTLPFSILLVAYNVVPLIIGWLGIVASISLSFGNGIDLVKPNFKKPILKVLLAIGGLGAIVFEVILGGWLLFFY